MFKISPPGQPTTQPAPDKDLTKGQHGRSARQVPFRFEVPLSHSMIYPKPRVSIT